MPKNIKMKTGRYKILISFFVFGLLVSCLPPKNKEEYLARFESFIERVEENHKKYNKKDWEWADSRFEKFNTQWYLKFKNVYSFEDQIRVKTLIVKYNALKNDESFGKVIKDLFKDDVDEVKKKVENYVEKDFDEDMENIIEGAAAIGDSAIKILEEMIEKIDNSF